MTMGSLPGLDALPPSSREALFVCAIVLVAILVLGLVVVWIKRRYGPGSDDSQTPALSIDQVDRLYRDGQISRQEFETLRRVALKLEPGGVKSDKSSLTQDANVDDDKDGTVTREAPAPPGPKECK